MLYFIPYIKLKTFKAGITQNLPSCSLTCSKKRVSSVTAQAWIIRNSKKNSHLSLTRKSILILQNCSDQKLFSGGFFVLSFSTCLPQWIPCQIPKEFLSKAGFSPLLMTQTQCNRTGIQAWSSNTRINPLLFWSREGTTVNLEEHALTHET